MGNIPVKSAKAEFERYISTYKALSSMLDNSKQMKEVLSAIEIKITGETDQIYIKNVKLGFPPTQRIYLCHTLAIHNGVVTDPDRIVLKEPNETGNWSQELHYQLSIPWYEMRLIYAADTPGAELPIKTFDPMCPSILEVEVTIKACDLISAAFLSTVTPAVPIHIHGIRRTIRDFMREEIEINVSLEPDISYNTYKEIAVKGEREEDS